MTEQEQRMGNVSLVVWALGGGMLWLILRGLTELSDSMRRVRWSDVGEVMMWVFFSLLVMGAVGLFLVWSYTNVRHHGGRWWITYLWTWTQYGKNRNTCVEHPGARARGISSANCSGCGASKGHQDQTCDWCGQ